MSEVRAGYKRTEVGVIPEDWDAPTLGELLSFKNGLNKAKKYFGSGTPIVNYMDVYERRGLYGQDLQGRVSLDRQEIKSFDVKKGDLFFTRTSETSAEVGISSVMLDSPKNAVFSGFVLRGRSKNESLDNQFKKYCFSTKIVRKQITSQSTETTRALTNGRALSSVVIARPPLPEQRAIATALSDVDALIVALDRLIAKKRDLKQAAMQQLLTGQTRLPGFSGKWEAKRLGDCLLSKPDYGMNAPAVPFSDKLPSYIRITDISEHGRFCPDPRVSVKAESADQLYLKKGDMVFVRTGASVGKSYLYDSKDGPLVFAGFLIRVQPNPESLVPAFLSASVTTNEYWNWVRLMSMRSGQPGINGNEYAQMLLLLPSVPEQTAIAAVLADMDAEISALERRRDKTRALKQGMMQELLTGRTRLV